MIKLMDLLCITCFKKYIVKQGGSWREFDALTKLPKGTCEVKCSCDASKELLLHQQLIKLMQFLMGFDDCYQPVRSALFTRDPLPEVKDATILCLEKNHIEGLLSPLIIDSGANQHFTVSTVRMFNIVDVFDLKLNVGHPNGTISTISHVGNLNLTNNVILYDVLMVLGYYVSLLSVNKLTRDSTMFIDFDEDKCYIQDFKKKKILGTGSETGGLYLFNMNNDYSVGKSNVVLSSHVPKLLWHNRLGHLADQVLFVLKNNLSISKNSFVPVCEVCHRAKQTGEKVLDNVRLLLVAIICVKCPNDEGKDSPVEDGSVQPSNDIADSAQGTPVLRRYSKQSKLPVKLNDYVLNSNVKYGIEKYMNYSNLKGVNLCFATTLNKSVDSTCLSDALSDANWEVNEYGKLNTNHLVKLKDCGKEDQAPRQRNAKLTTALIKHGFEQSKFDYSLYVKKKGSMFVSLLVYVVDIVSAGNDETEIDLFKNFARDDDVSVSTICCLSFARDSSYVMVTELFGLRCRGMRSRFSKTTCATCWLVHSWCYVEEECYLVDPASSHMLVSKIKPCMFKKLVVGLWVGSAGPPYGVHRFTRPFCRRCAPGLNWLGRASGAVTLKKLECSKQAYALRTTAKAFAKDVFINQERKLGARRRSDTVLVSTINDADQGSADVAYRTPLAPYEKSKFLGFGESPDIGYTQEEGIDYDEVFALVARIKAIRLFLAYASFKDFVVYQMDVKSAFLYGMIEEEVYVCQPSGFEDPEFPSRVYKVEKALYGLHQAHQAPRAWYETLSTYLLDNGFQRGQIDKTLFIKRVKGDILLVQVYVDDIILGSTKKGLCTDFEKMMHKKF
ncbi:putative ribonuclease H-like domain-containing protein [Tanacetum coccineum]|uniref:Ribonuclease H-like domain-containing protein n=1 Tax=Tanacetum coccineum TaxID=301880 RepID=A0ABQ5GWI8_9ASTR